MGTVSGSCSKSFVLQRTRPRLYNSEEGKTKHQEAQISETLMRFRLRPSKFFYSLKGANIKAPIRGATIACPNV